MENDVPLEAEQGHRDFSRTLPGNRGAQSRHSHRTCGRNNQRGEDVGITKPIGVDPGKLDQIVVECYAHGFSAHTRAGEAATASR